MYQILEGVGNCCGCNIYWRGLGTAVVVTDIGGVGGCCACNIYRRGLRTGLRTAVVVTDIGGDWELLCL